METLERQIMRIEKEDISNLHFPHQEVLNDKQLKIQRNRDLNRGLILGNAFHTKVKINFENGANMYQVETTIWGLGQEFVLLKQGVFIPRQRIHKVII
jgi:hypothetical protein